MGSSVVIVGSVLLKDFCSKNRLLCTRIYKSLLQQCDVQFLTLTQNGKRKVEQVQEDDCEMENEGVKQLFRLITSEQKQNYRSQSKISACALDIGVAVPRSSFETCKFDDARVKEKHVGILSMMVLDLQPFSFVSDLGFTNFCYRIGSEMFHKNCLDKAFDDGFK